MNINGASQPLRNQVSTPAAAPAAPQSSAAVSGDRVELQGSASTGLENLQPARNFNSASDITVSVLLKGAKAITDEAGTFKTMSAAQHQAYEPTSDQIADVKKFAEANGLSVASVDPSTLTVKLKGAEAQCEQAFGVHLERFQDDKGNVFRGHKKNVNLPKFLEGNVEHVLGLSDRRIAEPHISSVQTKGLVSGYNPVDVAKAYHFPKGTDGSGQTIAIIELGGGYNQSDLDTYFGKLGIPTPNVSAIGVDGAANTPENNPNGADGEVALDIEVAGAVAPKANFKVYFAPNSEQGFVDAVNQAASDMGDKPGAISISWGAPEDVAWTPAGQQALNKSFQDATAKGINVFSASGDNGSVDGQKDGKNHADFPSSSPWAVATGGTKLKMNGSGERSSEVAWGGGWIPGMGASGGGVSTIFPQPDFQKGAGVPNTADGKTGRGVPDLAGNASPETGYDVLVDGKEASIGGTSAVAPLFAALSARLAQGLGDKPLGYLNPFFYKHADDFTDIVKGNNGGFKAGPGWDAVTGLGAPDGEKLLASLKAASQETVSA